MRLLYTALCFAGFSLPLAAHTYDEVLVVANQNSPESVGLAYHFAARRGIAEDHVALIDCPGAETISRAQYDRQIHRPLLRLISDRDLEDRIQFIVLMRGVPLRIDGGSPASPELSMAASVDSELTLLRWELVRPRSPVPLEGRVRNPYFNADPHLSGGAEFTTEHWPIFLVTRLDGFTSDDVRALIAHADEPRAPGLFAIDLRGREDLPGAEDGLPAAAQNLQALGMQVSLERTQAVLDHVRGLSGYASWGCNDPAQPRHLDLGFLPGAIACPLVSTSARTFVAPPDRWEYPGSEDRAHYYMNTAQSLIGDLIRLGVTGVSGNVWEPSLAGTAQPMIALPAYARGYTLAEAFYQSMPSLSWMAVVVGDPLAKLAR